MIPTPSTAQDGYVVIESEQHLEGEIDAKRPVDYPESRPTKKMKVESDPAAADISLTH